MTNKNKIGKLPDMSEKHKLVEIANTDITTNEGGEMRISATKRLVYLHFNKKLTKTALKNENGNKGGYGQNLAKELGVDHVGFMAVAISQLIDELTNPSTLKKKIKGISEKSVERAKLGRSRGGSAGALNRDIQGIYVEGKNAKNALERAKKGLDVMSFEDIVKWYESLKEKETSKETSRNKQVWEMTQYDYQQLKAHLLVPSKVVSAKKERVSGRGYKAFKGLSSGGFEYKVSFESNELKMSADEIIISRFDDRKDAIEKAKKEFRNKAIIELNYQHQAHIEAALKNSEQVADHVLWGYPHLPNSKSKEWEAAFDLENTHKIQNPTPYGPDRLLSRYVLHGEDSEEFAQALKRVSGNPNYNEQHKMIAGLNEDAKKWLGRAMANLNHASEYHYKIYLENKQLSDKAFELMELIRDGYPELEPKSKVDPSDLYRFNIFPLNDGRRSRYGNESGLTLDEAVVSLIYYDVIAKEYNEDELRELLAGIDGYKMMGNRLVEFRVEKKAVQKPDDRKGDDWTETINGYEFTIIEEADGLTIERVFTPKTKRGRGMAIPSLKELIKRLETHGKELYATVMPDEETDEEYAKLRHIFNSAGFVPDPQYRNDFKYLYQKPRYKTILESDIVGVEKKTVKKPATSEEFQTQFVGASSKVQKALAKGYFTAVVHQKVHFSEIEVDRNAVLIGTSTGSLDRYVKTFKKTGLIHDSYVIKQVVDGHTNDPYAIVYDFNDSNWWRRNTEKMKDYVAERSDPTTENEMEVIELHPDRKTFRKKIETHLPKLKTKFHLKYAVFIQGGYDLRISKLDLEGRINIARLFEGENEEGHIPSLHSYNPPTLDLLKKIRVYLMKLVGGAEQGGKGANDPLFKRGEIVYLLVDKGHAKVGDWVKVPFDIPHGFKKVFMVSCCDGDMIKEVLRVTIDEVSKEKPIEGQSKEPWQVTIMEYLALDRPNALFNEKIGDIVRWDELLPWYKTKEKAIAKVLESLNVDRWPDDSSLQDAGLYAVINSHYLTVKEAYLEGKTIPIEILSVYPKLKPKVVSPVWTETINGYEFTIIEEADGLTIERVFTPKTKRGRGMAIPSLKELIKRLETHGKELYATVMPDEETDEEYAKLRHIFNSAGFTPDPDYRNDFVYSYGQPMTHHNYRHQIIQTLHEKFAEGWRKVIDGAPKGHLTKKPLLQIGKDIMGDDFDLHFYWEVVELAWVLYYRKLIAANKRQPLDLLLQEVADFYRKVQPTYDFSTSTKRIMQQYSTSAPVAFLAGKYCRVHEDGIEVFEPSGGNGLLTVLADPKRVTINELDNLRYENLEFSNDTKFQYKRLMKVDGTKPFGLPDRSFDAVLTNPPFISMQGDRQEKDGFTFYRVEHWMAALALDKMKDGGRAAIITGDWLVWKGGRIRDHRTFFNWLGRHYWIDDIINIHSGKLYNKQGTAFPMQMILIGGRKAHPSGGAPVYEDLPNGDEVVDSFEWMEKRVDAAIERASQPRFTIMDELKLQTKMIKFELA